MRRLFASMPGAGRRLALGLALWCGAGSASALELLIASNEYPPYVSSNPRQSFLTELYQHIGKEMGVTFVFKFMPWKRCRYAVDQQQVWGAVPILRTRERAGHYLFSDRLYVRKAKFFYYSNPARPWPAAYGDLAQIKPFVVGGVLGYWYEQLFREAGLRLDLTTTDERNFEKLRAGRFELAIADENVAEYIIAHQFPAQDAARFRSLEGPVFSSETFMIVNPDAPGAAALMERFNRALEAVRKRGVVAAMISRYKLKVGQ